MHGVSATFPGNIQLEEGNVDQQVKSMQQEVSSIAGVISDCTKKPVSEIGSGISLCWFMQGATSH